MQLGRSLQGLRAVLGGCHAGTAYANRRSGRHLRHGRTHPAANVAVHPAVRQEDSRPASRSDADQTQEFAHRESTVRVQHGVCPVQAVPTREAEE